MKEADKSPSSAATAQVAASERASERTNAGSFTAHVLCSLPAHLKPRGRLQPCQRPARQQRRRRPGLERAPLHSAKSLNLGLTQHTLNVLIPTQFNILPHNRRATSNSTCSCLLIQSPFNMLGSSVSILCSVIFIGPLCPACVLFFLCSLSAIRARFNKGAGGNKECF